MLTAVINTTAQKKSDIKKPEDVMHLPMDDINNYHKGKAAEARASKERQQEVWQMFRKVRPLDQDGKLKA